MNFSYLVFLFITILLIEAFIGFVGELRDAYSRLIDRHKAIYVRNMIRLAYLSSGDGACLQLEFPYLVYINNSFIIVGQAAVQHDLPLVGVARGYAVNIRCEKGVIKVSGKE